MPSRLPLPVWGGVLGDAVGDAQRAREAIDAWTSSTALAELVLASGGGAVTARGEDLLRWLDEFSAEHWDFRRGAERNLAPRVELPAELERVVPASVTALGLVGPYPLRRSSYDTVLMTGGMIRAGLVKPRFVRELLDAGVKVSNVVFLGGFRPFAGDELALAPVFGVDGDNEVDAMVRGVELAFGPVGEPSVSGEASGRGNGSWRVWRWNVRGVTLRVVAAPSSQPTARRANTRDTYRYWAEHVRQESESSVLVVTMPIYVPYQGAGAVELLGLEHGLAVETVGTSDTANNLGQYSQPFRAQNHLQELRAAIGAMRKLRVRLTAILKDEGDRRDDE